MHALYVKAGMGQHYWLIFQFTLRSPNQQGLIPCQIFRLYRLLVSGWIVGVTKLPMESLIGARQ